ncbi:VWA domain-containing protein [Ramlibacter sp. PS4R-6]|uniref:VWA domain-containing protein n=1 Tax=Ramlibacter sp. PS4R-6 TaxID=3133438 RepID=UPI0030A4D696
MHRPPFFRTVAALVAAQLVLSACSVSAQPQGLWPDPEPAMPSTPGPIVRSVPNFRAPSATNCARPVSTREVPGFAQGRRDARDALASRDARAKSAPAEGAAAPAAPSTRGEGRALADAESLHRMFPSPQPAPQRRPVEPVTVGMVDDNASFAEYLAFVARTPVVHRPRDVRERYLLDVKDARGRGVADAEVAVQSPSGHAMWARTDAGGRVWLHPDAFDPWRSPTYDVAVRKEGRVAWGRLARGQKSAVEVRLDAAAATWPARLDLVFLIDATGSMSDEIDKLKASLRAIVSEVSALPSRPDVCLGLVAYRDRGDAFITRTHDFTNDVGGFLRQALIPLRADGGGDYPEAMNEALHETVHRLSWRGDGATRLVVLLADAPPHLDYGAPHYDDDMVAALGKGIKVFSVGASGLDRQGEFIQRQIAQYTGGKFVFLTYADAHDPSSGPGRETGHDVKNYSVDTLDRLIVRLVSEELAKLAPRG